MEIEVEEDIFPNKSPEQDLIEVGRIFNHLVKDPSIAADLSSSEVLSRVTHKVEEERKSMSDQRTAQLWLHYLNMIAIYP